MLRVRASVVLMNGFSFHRKIDSAIKLIRANARGFRSFTNYCLGMLLHSGKLNIVKAKKITMNPTNPRKHY